jgi:hypothetical protein
MESQDDFTFTTIRRLCQFYAALLSHMITSDFGPDYFDSTAL